MAKSPKHNKTQSLAVTQLLEMAATMSNIQYESFKAGIEYQKQQEKKNRED
jgi:hypothetical protein|tara:strand:- start:945 stop:1097 length:153 start_codon:yes stop_codon:yes gene_type:complete